MFEPDHASHRRKAPWGVNPIDLVLDVLEAASQSDFNKIMPTLFDSVRVGELDLSNRMVMSPLTRCRASAHRIPNELMVEYYRQRSTAGMIISEATSICPMGVG